VAHFEGELKSMQPIVRTFEFGGKKGIIVGGIYGKPLQKEPVARCIRRSYNCRYADIVAGMDQHLAQPSSERAVRFGKRVWVGE
jgi:hypothetical protein